MEIKRAAFVVADISGYTQFVKHHDVALIHAEQIISDLLETVIDSAEFPLTISKLEGDAVFFYALAGDDDQAVAKDVLKQVVLFFDAFNEKVQELDATRDCPCDACTHIATLRLKAILHYGQAAFKQIRQFEELAGEDVILVHRLLKNSVPSKEYILLTEHFHQLAGSLATEEPEVRMEQVEGLGTQRVRIYYRGEPQPAEKDLQPGWLARTLWNQRLGIHTTLRKLGLKRGRDFSNLPQST